MRLITFSALTAGLLGCLLAGAPARAQFASVAPPQTGQTGGTSPNPTPSGGGGRYSGTVAFYPYAGFQIGSANINGYLVAGEAVFGVGSGHTAAGIGGWFWRAYDRKKVSGDLYEIHGKFFFTRELGVQVGVLGNSNGGGNPYDAFLIYNFSSEKTSPGSTHPWNVQVGAGPFIDPTGGSTSTDPTAFIDGNVEIVKNVVIDGSYWFIRDKGTSNSRVAVGLGYKFH